MIERFMVCPQCGITRFLLRSPDGRTLIVQVTRDLVITPLNPDESLEGFDTEVLYCLGCSWKGSKRMLKKYL